MLVKAGLMMTMMMMMLLTGGCDGDNCTLGSIRTIQPDMSFPQEKLEGRWYVNKLFGHPLASSVLFYTIDVASTPTGLAVFSNIRTTNQTCDYVALEGPVTDYVLVRDTQSEVTAAADKEVQHILVYLCASELLNNSSPCLQPFAFLASRVRGVTTAGVQWLESLMSEHPLPCFGSDQDNTGSFDVLQNETDECPLNQMIQLPGRDCQVANFPVQANFSLLEYVSKPWKEIKWLAPFYIPPSEFYQDYEHRYILNPDGTLTAHVSSRNPLDDNKCIFYNLNMSTTSTPGKLLLHDGKGVVPYNIIYADYDRFALVYGCVNETALGTCQTARGWLWSRGDTLERQYRLQANAMIMDLCLNPAAWFNTQHDNPCTGTSGADGISTGPWITVAMTLLLLCGVPKIA